MDEVLLLSFAFGGCTLYWYLRLWLHGRYINISDIISKPEAEAFKLEGPRSGTMCLACSEAGQRGWRTCESASRLLQALRSFASTRRLYLHQNGRRAAGVEDMPAARFADSAPDLGA